MFAAATADAFEAGAGITTFELIVPLAGELELTTTPLLLLGTSQIGPPIWVVVGIEPGGKVGIVP